jgi:hypothetical protein
VTPANHAASEREIHPAQRQSHVKPVTAPLHVIAVISNAMRFESRYRLYRAFEHMVEHSGGAILTTVELATRDRHFEVTDHRNPRHLQLRSPSVLWHKENLVNLGIQHLSRTDPDWEYVAWIDADVTFLRSDWATEAVHLLQMYDVIQMWTSSVDLGPHGEPIANCTSLIANWMQNEHILQPWSRQDGKADAKPAFSLLDSSTHDGSEVHGQHGHHGHGKPPPAPGLLHTGYAYAARRSAIADLGGLGDIGILGSGDRSMAYALIGEVDKSFPKGIHPSYAEYWRTWQERAEQHIRRNVGVMAGTLVHHFHGSKQHRRYQDRWKVLVEHQFQWLRDIKYSPQGTLEWTHANPVLERDVRHYFAVRNEDSTDLS